MQTEKDLIQVPNADRGTHSNLMRVDLTQVPIADRGIQSNLRGDVLVIAITMQLG
jgi:hypothetical protein